MAQWAKIHLQCRRHGFDPWVRKIPWRRKWQPTQEFLPGKSHGQWNLEGYSPQGCKEFDMNEATEHACAHTHTLTHTHTHTRRINMIQPCCMLEGRKGKKKAHKQCRNPITTTISSEVQLQIYFFQKPLLLHMLNLTMNQSLFPCCKLGTELCTIFLTQYYMSKIFVIL